jgi:hypothetical protein
MLKELGVAVTLTTRFFEDNQSTMCIQAAKNLEHCGRMKHLDIRILYIRDLFNVGKLRIEHVSTWDQAKTTTIAFFSDTVLYLVEGEPKRKGMVTPSVTGPMRIWLAKLEILTWLRSHACPWAPLTPASRMATTVVESLEEEAILS